MAKKPYRSRKKEAGPSPLDAGRKVLDAASSGDYPVYLLYGKEQYAAELTAEKLVAGLLREEERDFGLQVLSGAGVSIPELCEALDGLPLFGGRRVVLLKRCGVFQERGTADAVCARLPEKGGGTTFIILEEGVDRRISLFKEIGKRGLAVRFAPFSETDNGHLKSLHRLVNSRLKTDGTTMAEKELFYLVQLVGTDLRSILTEVEKLSLYSGGGKNISREAIDLLVVPTRETVAYQLADAVASGDLKGALAFLRRLLGQKEEPLRILAMLQKRFRFLIQARALMDEGIIDARAAEGHYGRFKISLEGVPDAVRGAFSKRKGANLLAGHPYVAYKTCQAARRMPARRLLEKMDKVINADRELKGGRRSRAEALEDLVIGLCAAGS